MAIVRFTLPQFIVALLLLPIVAGNGCSAPNATVSQMPTGVQPTATSMSVATRQLKVVTTFLPVYLFTKAVAGNAAKVEILIKPGTEVHEYQSTPADVQAIAQADVVVKNGLGIEAFLDGTVKSAENPKLKMIDASSGIKPLQEISPVVGGGDKATHPEHQGAGNPHVWLDPVLARQQVENIRDGLVAADPSNKATYQANAAAYIRQLADLNNQFEQRLKGVKTRTFITFHDAFPYLAKRYQLQQVAVVAIPEDQLSPDDVQKALAAVKQFNVKALFSEPGVDQKLLTSLSTDLKLTLRPLDSLEAGQTDPQYYFTVMKNNLQTLESAFK